MESGRNCRTKAWTPRSSFRSTQWLKTNDLSGASASQSMGISRKAYQTPFRLSRSLILPSFKFAPTIDRIAC